MGAFHAKICSFRIIILAFWAFHFYSPSLEIFYLDHSNNKTVNKNKTRAASEIASDMLKERNRNKKQFFIAL